MKRLILVFFIITVSVAIGSVFAEDVFEEDIILTSAGDLKITFIGHSTLMFTFVDMVIHIDPWSRLADYTKLPKADLVIITHDHPDHLDLNALEIICTKQTELVYTETCAVKYEGGTVMKNGDTVTFRGLNIEAVPAYNFKRENRRTVHPKGEGNGYIITFGDKRVYVASETENIPELKLIKGIDVAFLAMDSRFNMTPENAVEAAKVFMPKILYPYHFGKSDMSVIESLLKDTGIEVRIRDMK
ncbi:MBL fold metallo-hydrolase [Candidatus Latescibacterota bacterium]